MTLIKGLEIGAAALVGFYACAAFCRSPRLAVGAWLAVTCLVPSWLIVRIGVQWTPAGVMAALILPSILLNPPRSGWHRVDVVATGIVVICLLAFWQGGTPRALATQVIVRGLLAYLVARHLAPRAGMRWTQTAFAAVLLVCSAWSVAEYLLNLHVFTSFDLSSPEAYWAAVQTRGGHIRSVAAFGQPIALGGAIAMAVPFILASSWRTTRKLLGVSLIGCGILATISRGPMGAVLLGALLTLMVYRGSAITRRERNIILVGGTIVGIALYSALATKLSAAGSEASSSATYRGTLYSYVLGDVHPLSLASNVFASEGRYLYRSFGSIDSTFIYGALFYGWLVIAFFSAALLGLVGRTLRGRAGPAAIAFVAQIPVLATVAPITQYQTLLWFLGGLVAAEALPARAGARRRPQHRPFPPARAVQPAP